MNTAVLTDEQTLEEVIECLMEHVSIDMQGDLYGGDAVYRVGASGEYE